MKLPSYHHDWSWNIVCWWQFSMPMLVQRLEPSFFKKLSRSSVKNTGKLLMMRNHQMPSIICWVGTSSYFIIVFHLIFFSHHQLSVRMENCSVISGFWHFENSCGQIQHQGYPTDYFDFDQLWNVSQVCNKQKSLKVAKKHMEILESSFKIWDFW